jgi:hypothetical protein
MCPSSRTAAGSAGSDIAKILPAAQVAIDGGKLQSDVREELTGVIHDTG